MTEWPDVDTVLGQARSEGYLKTNLFNPIVDGLKEQPGGGPEQALTLDAGGTILPVSALSKAITVDSFGAASTDSVDFISQTNTFDGAYVQLRAVNAAHVITLKHNTSGTGKLSLQDSVDYILDDVEKKILLQRRGTIWYEVWRSHAKLPEPETEIATTSGTSHDFTGISANARRITIMLDGISLGGSPITSLMIQLGDAGGFEASGYVGSSSSVGAYSAGFLFAGISAAAEVYNCRMTLILMDPANNTWVEDHIAVRTDSANQAYGTGIKSLSPGPLSQVRLTTASGTDTFDAGAFSILVEE